MGSARASFVHAWIAVLLGSLAVGVVAGQPVLADAGPAARQAGPLVVMHFVDVGNGDAAWVTLADGATALIDCGPPDPNKRLILALQSAGVRHIDLLAPSRARSDAVGGCADVIRYLTVSNVLVPTEDSNETFSRGLYSAVDANAVTRVPATARWSRDYGDSRLSLFNPGATPIGGVEDDSQVILLEYGNARALFAGAIHEYGEIQALAEGLNGYQVQVLRVADHGVAGTTSQAFLDAVFSSPDPKLAILSYSAAARAPQPSADVIARLAASGATLLRTPRDGSITVMFDADGKLTWVTER
jgi:competence protein ComEC